MVGCLTERIEEDDTKEEDMRLKDMRLKSYAAGLRAAVIMVTAFSVPSADARSRKDERYYDVQRYDAQPRSQGRYGGETLSLDGRNTGQPRTCGYAYFQYDHRGATVGPYCH